MRTLPAHMPRVAVKIKAGGGHARVARWACRVGGMKEKYDFKSKYLEHFVPVRHLLAVINNGEKKKVFSV